MFSYINSYIFHSITDTVDTKQMIITLNVV